MKNEKEISKSAPSFVTAMLQSAAKREEAKPSTCNTNLDLQQIENVMKELKKGIYPITGKNQKTK